MVSYRKRGKVWQYEISYKDQFGKYKKLRKSGFEHKSDAVLAASQMQLEYPNLSSAKSNEESLVNYYHRWINVFKKNNVTPITFNKYENTGKHIYEIFGNLKLKEITKLRYQEGLNYFARNHAKRTVSCFHKQVRACLLEALDERIILSDPTRKAVITGVERPKTNKVLSYENWSKLISNLNPRRIDDTIIYVAAVTGMRYGEIVGLTTDDIDFNNRYINVTKTWDYKYKTGFMRTKTKSSIRKIAIDRNTVTYLNTFIQSNSPKQHMPIFMYKRQHVMVSAEINKALTYKLDDLNIPRITFHGLRHTHASILLYKGVSILSVSRRLGHSNITTTQSTYLHIIRELQSQDQNKIVSILNMATK
ncbi:site-specific integrase [Companilactobacillus furfuricola]|uniref:site-specific integrase n=1 Tax=Companilactobacillus furfuricola TaxID=1462575 RepID=UPI000F76E3B3|nr:site-specific integrase [Companilactobacillus furfuricola]